MTTEPIFYTLRQKAYTTTSPVIVVAVWSETPKTFMASDMHDGLTQRAARVAKKHPIPRFTTYADAVTAQLHANAAWDSRTAAVNTAADEHAHALAVRRAAMYTAMWHGATP